MKPEICATPQVLQELFTLRKNDKYHPDMDAAGIQQQYAPENVAALALSLSDITAAFYGILLQQADRISGNHVADALSQTLLYQLGYNKGHRVTENHLSLQHDARGAIEVIIATILTASPEFSFSVETYAADAVMFKLTGHDRYHRIARQLDIINILEWPVVLPFFNGVCAAVAPGYTTTPLHIDVDDDSACDYTFIIGKEPAAVQSPVIQTGMNPPFFKLPDAPLVTKGKLLEVELGRASDFLLYDFIELVRYCISAEAWNANRLYPTGADQYMLGDKFRAVRFGTFTEHTQYKAVVDSLVIKKRKRKSLVRVLSESGELIYLMMFDYFMWNSGEFKRKFAQLKSEVTFAADIKPPLPTVTRTSFDNPYAYTAVLSPVTEAQCAGHFDGYPLVPGLLLMNVLLHEAEKWINDIIGSTTAKPILDTLTIHPNRAMQTNTPFNVAISVYSASATVFKFVHTITHDSDPSVVLSFVEFDIEI
ncbi:hypothetical protein [Chitinophaga sp. Cy-1792]|uniref:hypothetical protein n=1 Tax=Chitinophaga sp. Cy-1792 TaxID=2608339 RepID=UPI0014242CAC|nr:hypothetical protein [Chitinophaga sp. Cy-1792]NIG55080.1 hypothetical protein [Chitinophaga sp. Cy-1792]